MALDWIKHPCPKPNQETRKAAMARQAILTKPAGSLGRLEQLAIDFAGWQSKELPRLDTVSIRIFAADHGVCAQGVSAFPQQVTAQMIDNFLRGGAAISVLAERMNADFSVINLGTVSPIEDAPRLINRPISQGTADFTQQPAMDDEQLITALNVGRDSVTDSDLFIGGEMGIGNTCSASAIFSALLKLSAAETVGPGTGIDSQTMANKARVIDHALRFHEQHLDQAIDVLKRLGGFEIAALTGAYICAAQKKIPIVIDGFICTAAALIAIDINPDCRAWMIFAHNSAEPAHKKALDRLSAEPLLDLGLRLGEGSGAALAVPMIEQALLLHANMATFTDAGVSDKNA